MPHEATGKCDPQPEEKLVNRNTPRTGQHDEIGKQGCLKSYYKYIKIFKEKQR